MRHARLSACGLCVLALTLLLPLAACGGGGSDGQDGAPGAPGASTGVLQGTVTNSVTGLPVANLNITLNPNMGSAVTNGAGAYSFPTLPVGNYTVTCAGANYTTQNASVGVLAAQTTTRNFTMVPTSPVVVWITGAPSSSAPGSSFNLTANVATMDGSTVTGYDWEFMAGPLGVLGSPLNSTTAVTLADSAAYKASFAASSEVLNRWRVMPVNPHSLDAGAETELGVDVTTTSGTYHAHVAIVPSLPFAAWASGIQNVPVGLPVLLQGKDQASYNWTLSFLSTGVSTAVLQDATTRFPWFVPDVPGQYRLTVTQLPGTAVTLDVWAANWVGAIDGIDGNGDPIVDSDCMVCHTGLPGGGPLEQFDAWKVTGHAQIFRDQMNTSTHYGEGCFPCHTVGYETTASNGGFDDASGYPAFLAAFFPGGHMTPRSTNYANVVSGHPTVAKLGNIQCENCHGPNGAGGAHGLPGFTPDPRISLASDVCGVCHGEPPRHGRFQQWEESGHGNYEAAIAEGMSTSCARCHSAQGFLAWLPRLLSGSNGSLPGSLITWNADSVHPVTCVVCHDPHDVGTVSGNATNAPVRVEGDIENLPSGYSAHAVGKGAMCITCHNTRNGQRDDASYTGNTDDRAPHVAAQGDVLLGFNAYFVDRGARGGHSFLQHTCVTCHMEATPPPAGFSYNQSGTNHDFAASMEICGDCHGDYDGGTLQDYAHERLVDLEERISEALTDIANRMLYDDGWSLTVAHVIVNPDGSESGDLLVTFNPGDTINYVELQEEFHGRQAMRISVNGTLYENIQLAKADFSNGQDIVHAYYGQTVARAGWNYYLLHGDGSHAVHNPDFFFDAVDAAIEALEAASSMYP